MTPIQQLSGVLHTVLAVVLLAFLVFKWREYRIAALRDRLFALREELFDYAADGHVSFNHRAYTRLRMLINSTIRFAHYFTGSRLLAGLLFFRIFGFPKTTFTEEWAEALTTLPSETQERLQMLRFRVVVLLVKHLVTGWSPVLLVFLVCFAVGSLVKGAAKWTIEAFARQLPGVEILETQLIQEDIAERQLRDHPEVELALP